MGRHGYSDDFYIDNWPLIMWRGRVASSIRGKRGQAMLRELRDALDAMPNKRLIEGDLVTDDGDCCALGALLLDKEVPDPQRYHEDNEALADELDVAEPLVREIEWENDERGLSETPEGRWKRMRAWVDRQISSGSPK